MRLEEFGKILILFALLFFVTGMFLYFIGKFLGIGRFPGDIVYRKDGFTFYFPLGLSLVISLILTLLLNLLFFLLRK